MIPKSIQFGPFIFHTYGFIFALAIFIGWAVAKKRAHLYNIPKETFEDPILLIPLILSVLLARLYHVLDYWNLYKNNPREILNISGGGLGIWGGLFGILIGFWIVTKIKKLNLISTLDLIAPSVLLGQAIGRFGNFVNQEAFGPPTNLPWGVYISPQNRPLQFITSTHFHPTFFYEAAIDLIFFIVLLKLSQKLKKPGQMFALYLVLYSFGRFIVEFFRTDTATIGSIKVAQILAVGSFLIGLQILFFSKKRQNKGVDRA